MPLLSCNVDRLDKALVTERSAVGGSVLEMLKENTPIVRTQRLLHCQDTGFVICFAAIGQDVYITDGYLDGYLLDGYLEDAVNDGVRRGYREGYRCVLIVADPFKRKNTGDNTPVVVHTWIVPGDRLMLMVIAKGGGGVRTAANIRGAPLPKAWKARRASSSNA